MARWRKGVGGCDGGLDVQQGMGKAQGSSSRGAGALASGPLEPWDAMWLRRPR